MIFVSHLFDECMKGHGCKLILSVWYYSQTNSPNVNSHIVQFLLLAIEERGVVVQEVKKTHSRRGGATQRGGHARNAGNQASLGMPQVKMETFDGRT